MHTADEYEEEAAGFSEQSRIADETVARLSADPAVQQWLQHFWGDGGGLIEHYAQEKASYLAHGPGWLAQAEERATRPYAEAYERLWEIQQKKLFNRQCEWRAGILDLPGVETGLEFAAWGKDISRCPLLPPIAADEVALYQEYLLSDECVDIGPGTFGQPNLQDYDMFRLWHQRREAGADSPGHELSQALPEDMQETVGHLFNQLFHYPEWYAYYDRHYDTGGLLHLPDERGPAPSPAWAGAEADDLAHPDSADEAPAGPPLRHLSANSLALTETLVKRFESRQLLEYMRAVEFQPEQDHQPNAVYDVYAELLEEIDPVPVPAGPDWRECLRRAQLAHEKRRLARMLQAAYREYCLREQAGIAHPSPEGSDPDPAA